MSRILRPARIAVQVALITIVLLPVMTVGRLTGARWRRHIPLIWHTWVARALSLRITVHGTPPVISEDTGTLIAANHISWLDIVALGATCPVSFIAKAEVADWPLFGMLAKWQDTLFIDRDVRSSVRDQAKRISQRLDHGDMLVLFPEGTTSDGNFLYAFKSSLFGAVGITGDFAGERYIQPVAIVYTHWHGLPMGRFDRPLASWPGDVTLGPHLMRVLREGVVDVTVVFGEPIAVTAATNRKQLTRDVEASVRQMASQALRGRLEASQPEQKALHTAP